MEDRTKGEVWVFAEQEDGELAGIVFELLGKARELADGLGVKVGAALMGSGVESLAAKLLSGGADVVHLVDDPVLKTFRNGVYRVALVGLVKECSPQILLFGATHMGRDLAPSVASALQCGLTADCTDLRIGDYTDKKTGETFANVLHQIRPAFGGNIIATIVNARHWPQMATVREGVMKPLAAGDPIGNDKARSLTVRHRLSASDLDLSAISVDVVEIVRKASSVNLKGAPIIVAGGAGVGSKENFSLLHELAAALGGAVGGSRAAVDLGYCEHERQIGQTGVTVRPKLMISCGISGAVQHLAGMQDSAKIIAINTDKDAPIFKVAHYGIVGDLTAVVPKLIKAIRNKGRMIAWVGALLTALTLSAPALAASTWYASAANYGKSGMSGRSETMAFGTIQEAVDAASAGDTVLILPGVYDKGTAGGLQHGTTWQPTRVVLTKKLTLRSRDGKASVHIVGEVKSDASGDPSQQKDSVSGIHVRSAANGSVIEGVTIRDCAMYANSAADNNGGAGVSAEDYGYNQAFYLCYSAVSNCCAYRAGATRSGVAIGVYYYRNWCYSGDAAANCNALEYTSCYNCIIAESGINLSTDFANAAAHAVREPGLMVNCTIVNNYGSAGVYAVDNAVADDRGHLYNCVVYDNTTDPACSKIALHNCAVECEATSGYASAEKVTYVKMTEYQKKLLLALSPVTGDYRPVSGGTLDGAGDKSYLTFSFIPEAYRYRDFEGQTFDSGTAVPIGVILASTESGTGSLLLSGSSLRGVQIGSNIACGNGQCVRADRFPSQVRIGKHPKYSSKYLLGYGQNAHAQYFGMYDHGWQTIPPKTNENGVAVATLTLTSSSYSDGCVYYVDATSGDDGNDGSEAAPFKTIQAAVDNCKKLWQGTGKVSLVWVKPGVYDKGGALDESYGALARVSVPSKTYISFRSTGGASVTFIEGAPDPDSPNGVGIDARRCVSAASDSAVSFAGFTLRKGYGPTNGTEGGRAGAARGSGMNQQLIDCVITDCHGYTACVNAMFCRRCLFTGNEVTGWDGLVVNHSISACIFANNVCTNTWACHPLASGAVPYHCTIWEPRSRGNDYLWSSSSWFVNSAAMNCGLAPQPSSYGRIIGSVIAASRYNVTSTVSVIHASPLIYDPANGDFRPVAGSPVYGAGEFSLAADNTSYPSAFRYPIAAQLEYDTCDYYNNSIIGPDGKIFAGAVCESTTTHDIYVDAVGGDDSADGLSADTAKKTLAAAMAVAKGGSTVYAAPGVYNEGTMSSYRRVLDAGFDEPSVANRVVVPSSVTLKATGSREETVIVGSNGVGEPLRPVLLEGCSKIVGFTICGGRLLENLSSSDDTYGGGVLGRGRKAKSVVENCIVTGNAAVRGGGGAYLTFDGCIITNNYLTADTSGHEAASGIGVDVYSSYIADSHGTLVFSYSGNFINCVFGGKLEMLDGSDTQILVEVRTENTPRVWNCIAYGQCSDSMDLSKADVRNCYFWSGSSITYGAAASDINTDYTRDELKAMFDAIGRPAADEAWALTLDNGYDLAKDFVGKCDIDGSLRVWNRKIDIGVSERSYEEAAAAKLGSSITLKTVSDNIKVASDGLEMLVGDTLAFDWQTGSVAGACRLNFSLADGARLAVVVNGVTHEVTSGDSLTFESALTEQQIEISCLAGSATIAKCGRSGGVYLHFR